MTSVMRALTRVAHAVCWLVLLFSRTRGEEPHYQHLITFSHPFGDEGINDRFGESIAVAGGRVFIGARDDDTGAEDAGGVFAFDRNGQFLFQVPNPEPATGDFFGERMTSVGDDKFLVNARRDDFAAENSGSAYLFDADGNLLLAVRNPRGEPRADFGRHLAARPDMFAIGASDDTTAAPGVAALGAAYLYDLEGNLLTTFVSPQALETGFHFGRSVTFVGEDKILIGDHFDSTGNARAGAVFLFDLDGNHLETFLNPTPEDQEQEGFGGSLAVVGDKLLIGTTQESSQVDFSGGAYLFSQEGDLLKEILDPEPARENWFGFSLLAVDDERFIIGSIFNDELGENAGKAYLYNTEGEILQEFLSPEPNAGDHFGVSFAQSGEDLLIGEEAPEPGFFRRGQVYIYQPVSIDGDATLDGVVDLADFSTLKDHFGAGDRFRQGDFDRDLDVDLADFGILKGNFGSVAATVPEPASLVLMLVGALVVARRCRRSSNGWHGGYRVAALMLVDSRGGPPKHHAPRPGRKIPSHDHPVGGVTNPRNGPRGIFPPLLPAHSRQE
jgi:hypothetical protein